jgi:hypothetical protein
MTTNFIITTELPEEHWKYTNFKDKNVLDLGCGRWDAVTLEDTTPYYFLKKGASKLIAVDILETEIDFYKNQNLKNAEFICTSIDNVQKIKELISTHNINVIKCDIEGNELLLLELTENDLTNVESFCIEYHGSHIKPLLENKLNELGYDITAIGKLWVEGFGVIFAEKIKK